MKKLILSFLVVLLIQPVFSSNPPKDIIPFFSYATFYSPEHGSYVETYLTILGHSLYFGETASGKFASTVEVTILMKQDNNIVDFKKINLKSPETEDTLSVNFSLVDVQRFALPNGSYDIEVKLTDVNSPIEPLYIIDAVTLEYDATSTTVSGIQLVERYKKSSEINIFTKAGYELVPLPLNFYPKSINSLTFYCEVYNTEAKLGLNEPFLIKTHIEQFETKKISANLQIFKREKAGTIHSFMHEFDITKLPSGNYILVVELRDKNNELISSNQLFFQRSNPPADTDFMEMNLSYTASFVNTIQSADTLIEYIRSVRPIATENEKYFIDKYSRNAETDRLKQFFYTFWADRSDNPFQAWNNYWLEIQKVQNSFGTKIKKGYQTDRGRVYLQYGPPNTIVSENREPSTYPYEIWHYYQLNNQRNRKFVFYNRDLVTNDYELIHSDALGEVQDYQWQIKLNQRNFATNDPDLQRSDWGWGSRVDDYWRNPR
jgi:GWxTD domain-containing protein